MRGSFKFIQQRDAMQCGVAALAMQFIAGQLNSPIETIYQPCVFYSGRVHLT